MLEEPLGKRIREARQKRRWSRAFLGEKLGVASETVLRWELKGTHPRPTAQRDLIELFGFQEEDFQRVQPPPEKEPLLPLDEASVPEVEKLPGEANVSYSGVPSEQSPSVKTEEAVTKEETPIPEPQPVDPSKPEEAPLQEEAPVHDIEASLPPKEDFKLYRGRRIPKHQGHGIVTRFPYVTVNGLPLPYFGPKRYDPEQERLFEWGYHGSGPRHLAESLLAHFFGETYPEEGYADRKDFRALLYGNAFKYEVIGIFARDEDEEWSFTSYQIRNWLLSLKERGITEKDLLEKPFHYDAETGLMKVDEETTPS